MQWLLHGALPLDISESLHRHGHKTHTVAELGLNEPAGAIDLFKAADKRQWDVFTADGAAVHALYEKKVWFHRTIVLLLPAAGDRPAEEAGAVGDDAEAAGEEADTRGDPVDRLFARYARLTPKRLYTVTASRVKVRQLPG